MIDRIQPREPRTLTPPPDLSSQIYSMNTPFSTIRDALLAEGLKHGSHEVSNFSNLRSCGLEIGIETC